MYLKNLANYMNFIKKLKSLRYLQKVKANRVAGGF